MKKIQVLRFFLFAYLFSLGFTNMIDLPDLGSKIKVPELVFPILFIIWVSVFYRQLLRIVKPSQLEWSILVYIATVFLATVFNPGVNSLLEAIAMLYLYGVMMIYKSSLHLLPYPLGWITKAFTVTGLLAASLGIIGYILYFFHIPTLLVLPADCYYGYFDELIRAVGLMVTPNMLHNFLGICLLLYLPGYLNSAQKNLHHHLILLLLSIAIILTFSKDILLLVTAILFLLTQAETVKRKRMVWKIAGIMLFIVCMIGTHFLLEKKMDYAKHLAIEQGCYEKEIRMEAGPFIVRFTNYSTNKIAAIRAGLEEMPFGIGPGQFNEYVGKLKTINLYPTYFINFDPHCTYTGAFAELGLIGLLALMYMIFQIARTLIKTAEPKGHPQRQISLGLSSCFLFIAMEAMILDTLHFRYIWILLGILIFLQEKKNQNELNPDIPTDSTFQTTS